MQNWNEIQSDKNRLTNILRAHIVKGLVLALPVGQSLKTLNKDYVIDVLSPTQVRLSKDNDEPASNIATWSPSIGVDGAIYGIDRVFNVESESEGNHKLSPGIIVLIVFLCVGAVLAIGGIGFAVYWFKFRVREDYARIN